MVVPESPKTPGSSPAFWFGVQTEKGDGALVQPIMAKELGYRPGSPSSFYMFQEIFDWVRARICHACATPPHERRFMWPATAPCASLPR